MFILTQWDFSKFPISYKARLLLQEHYSLPTIVIKSSDPLLSKSHSLKYAITYKRKIHRLFDLVKCNSEEVASNILGEYKYLVLQENIFSLKDLCEMSTGIYSVKIYELFQRLERHVVKECQTCEYKGGFCYNCNNGEVLMAYDVDRVLFCKNCCQSYHRKCCIVHHCQIEN